MPQTYTPIANYDGYPVSLPADGDITTTSFFYERDHDLYDRLCYTVDGGVVGIGRYDASLIKLGLTVTDPADVTPPTYSSAYVLPGSLSHHAGLINIDGELDFQNDMLANIETNVGSDVAASAPPVYSSNVYVATGSACAAAIGQLDSAANQVAVNAIAATAGLAAQLARRDNLITHVGADAELAPGFTYATEHLVTSDTSLKSCVEVFDKHAAGIRRQIDYRYEQAVIKWRGTVGGVYCYGWESFIDTSKCHPLTTATIDTLAQSASGAGKVYHTEMAGGGTRMMFRWQADGPIDVRFRLSNNHLDWGHAILQDYAYLAPTPTVSPTDNVVVDVLLSNSTSRLYNIAYLVIL